MLEGCTLLQPSQEILFHACSPIASAEPQFQLGFQDALAMRRLPVLPDSRFPEETPCPKAPHALQLPSSHRGAPRSLLGKGHSLGCHRAVPRGAATSAVELRFPTATRPQPRAAAAPSRRARGTLRPATSARGVRSHPAFPGWLQPRQQPQLSL